jgi:hypothetical protein
MELFSTAIQYVSPSALPLLLVVLFYIKIKNDRKSTKESRDQDSLNIHDALLKHSFQITALKDAQQLHAQWMEDMKSMINAMNIAIAKLDTTVASLNDAIRELKR